MAIGWCLPGQAETSSQPGNAVTIHLLCVRIASFSMHAAFHLEGHRLYRDIPNIVPSGISLRLELLPIPEGRQPLRLVELRHEW